MKMVCSFQNIQNFKKKSKCKVLDFLETMVRFYLFLQLFLKLMIKNTLGTILTLTHPRARAHSDDGCTGKCPKPQPEAIVSLMLALGCPLSVAAGPPLCVRVPGSK